MELLKQYPLNESQDVSGSNLNSSSENECQVRTHIVTYLKRSNPLNFYLKFPTKSCQPKSNDTMNLQSLNKHLWDDELDDLNPPMIVVESKAKSSGLSEIEVKSARTLLDERVTDHLRNLSDEAEVENIKSILGDLQTDDVIPVSVSNVNSPLKFWLHIRKENYERRYEDLFNKMQ